MCSRYQIASSYRLLPQETHVKEGQYIDHILRARLNPASLIGVMKSFASTLEGATEQSLVVPTKPNINTVNLSCPVKAPLAAF